MARNQQDNGPAPAARCAVKVVERDKDRWSEVRDPAGRAGVRDCLQARRGRGGTPARSVTEEPTVVAVA